MEYWQATHLSSDRPSNDIDQVPSKIRAIYDSHKPFFTREAFAQVVQSFDKILHEGQLDEIISITGIDGVEVQFRLALGKVVCQRRPGTDLELILWVYFHCILFRS